MTLIKKILNSFISAHEGIPVPDGRMIPRIKRGEYIDYFFIPVSDTNSDKSIVDGEPTDGSHQSDGSQGDLSN